MEDRESCILCDSKTDCRCGYCFECATIAEDKALSKNYIQHILTGIKHVFKFRFDLAKIDFEWCYESLTGTGDYSEKEKQKRSARLRLSKLGDQFSKIRDSKNT